MNAILILFLGALCGAIYTYFLRRNSDSLQKAQSYVFWALFISGLGSLAIAGKALAIVSWPLIGLAALAGSFVFLVFFSLSRAFQQGSSALTIGIFQSSCILPPLLMALIFGCDCGFTYTLFHGGGALLVVLGFLRSSFKIRSPITKKWLLYTGLATLSQVGVVTSLQYQALLTKSFDHPLLLPLLPQEAETGWFLPVFFGVVALANLKGLRHSSPRLIFDGVVGGLSNIGTTVFLMLALAWATPLTATLIVPISAVLTILFCNIWSIALYKEKVDWLGQTVALGGLLLSFFHTA